MRSLHDDGIFSPTVVGILVAGVVAIFTLSVVLATIGTTDKPFRSTANSPSAIGHQGFYALLQDLGLPVAQSRLHALVTAGEGDLLVVEEPGRDLKRFGGPSGRDVPPNVLLVLPKWTGRGDLLHDGWVSKVGPVDPSTVKYVLNFVDRAAAITRETAPATWAKNELNVAPKLDGDTQLIARSKLLRPIIGTQDKMLLGERLVDGRRIWVLADPDPLENHGIATAPNARFAQALVEAVRRGSGTIVFDETVNGLEAPERNILRLLFGFPFVIVTIEMLVALGLVLLATTSRFGGIEAAPPPFRQGKAGLIDTIAALMERAGHQAVILRRYASVKLAETGRALHAPQGLDEPALAGWVDRIARSRGIAERAAALLAEESVLGGRTRRLARLFDKAQAAYRLKKDILNGSGARSGDR